MRRPRVSVLLPLRDAGATLGACLESLAAQTLADFEVVAVDHGSQDHTPALLRHWFERLDLHVYRHEGGSLLDALNAGLERCKGLYVARMDGDDLSLPSRLEEQADWLDANPQTGLLGSRVELFAGSGPLSEGYRAYQDWINSVLEPQQIARELLVECPLPHPTWMARREVYERLGGYQDPELPEDYHFLLRCAQAGIGLAKHPLALLRWREHPERHSRTHPRYKREAFFKLKARFVQPLLGPGPYIVWGAGDRGRQFIRALKEAGVPVALCVGVDEGEGLRATEAHGVPVVLPEQLPTPLPGMILVCVGTPGIRPRVYAWMGERGLKEGTDWRFVS